MKPIVTMITGWAHGADSMQPLADLLAPEFDVQILTGTQVLTGTEIPEASAIIGWSMGGMLAIEHLPATCKKLVLVSSTVRFCATENYPCGIPEKLLRRMILQLQKDPDAVLTEFYKNVCHPLPPEKTSCENEDLARGLNYLLTADLRDRTASLRIPVLLLHGEKDLIIPSTASGWLAARLPNARFTRLANSGHKPLVSLVYPLIRHFLIETNHD